MSSTNTLIGAGVTLLVLLSLRKGRDTSQDAAGDENGEGVTEPTENDIRAGLERIADEYGSAIAKNVERIYRLETANFTSGLFRKTNAAGQRAPKPDFPFGWPVRGFGASAYAPVVSMAENAGGPSVQWVAFKHFWMAADYLAQFLRSWQNNPGRWNSTDPDRMAAYNAAISRINTQYV